MTQQTVKPFTIAEAEAASIQNQTVRDARYLAAIHEAIAQCDQATVEKDRWLKRCHKLELRLADVCRAISPEHDSDRNAASVPVALPAAAPAPQEMTAKHANPNPDAVIVKFRALSPHAVLPARATPGSACFDLTTPHDVTFNPRNTDDPLVHEAWLGFALEIPEGYEGQIRIRSSIAKSGWTIPNAPGTIDSDYRGEVCVLLVRMSGLPGRINAGTRFAQLAIRRVPTVEIVEVQQLSETTRGAGGFESTGI